MTDQNPHDGTRRHPDELDRPLTPAERAVADALALALPPIACDYEPSPDWLEKTLARVSDEAARLHPPRRRLRQAWRWGGSATLAVAAMVVCFVAMSNDGSHSPGVTNPALAVRGDELVVGTTITVSQRGEYLRLYYEDKTLLLTCPSMEGCRRSGDVWEAGVELFAPGRYQVLMLSRCAVGPPAGTFDLDLDAAYHAGCIVNEDEIEVR